MDGSHGWKVQMRMWLHRDGLADMFSAEVFVHFLDWQRFPCLVVAHQPQARSLVVLVVCDVQIIGPCLFYTFLFFRLRLYRGRRQDSCKNKKLWISKPTILLSEFEYSFVWKPEVKHRKVKTDKISSFRHMGRVVPENPTSWFLIYNCGKHWSWRHHTSNNLFRFRDVIREVMKSHIKSTTNLNSYQHHLDQAFRCSRSLPYLQLLHHPRRLHPPLSWQGQWVDLSSLSPF